ncbi:DNA repair protein RecO [Hydrogenophaga sp. SL48]|uniref:DNA repair protein RecO n=1 Tax=Hydrogenophaga sp. SL48 TaxID=2806347 RepID=UPI001EFFF616|nr:DNA repair protein RecO [Hydrogenophaga sp. SL48]UJW81619.1 DNA repair protein RecO [Hydrogenophaga sp. SL48]
MATRRFSEEPAFVLHRYDWSESSLILEVFARHHGRIALVAKGVKRPTSQFRPVLLPLQPLHLSWGGDAEVRTLKAAQWQGGHVMPTGEALLSGSYLNELLMRLLARDDPHASLYDHYALAVQLLAERADAQQLILRSFELLLLRDIGLLPDLATEGNTLAVLQDELPYVLGPESGLRAAHADDGHVLSGEQWRSLQTAMNEADPFIATLRACAGCQQALQPQLRHLLHYHCGVRVFKTRQLMLDMQAMSRPRVAPEPSPTHLQALS